MPQQSSIIVPGRQRSLVVRQVQSRFDLVHTVGNDDTIVGQTERKRVRHRPGREQLVQPVSGPIASRIRRHAEGIDVFVVFDTRRGCFERRRSPPKNVDLPSARSGCRAVSAQPAQPIQRGGIALAVGVTALYPKDQHEARIAQIAARRCSQIEGDRPARRKQRLRGHTHELAEPVPKFAAQSGDALQRTVEAGGGIQERICPGLFEARDERRRIRDADVDQRVGRRPMCGIRRVFLRVSRDRRDEENPE